MTNRTNPFAAAPDLMSLLVNLGQAVVAEGLMELAWVPAFAGKSGMWSGKVASLPGHVRPFQAGCAPHKLLVAGAVTAEYEGAA